MVHIDIGRIQNDIARVMAGDKLPTSVVLQWEEWPVDSIVNPVTGGRSGTPVMRTETQPALVHYVAAAGHGSVRQFNEIEVGDVILDFMADVQIDGRTNLRYGLPGDRWYVNKPVSDLLAQSWDVVAGGQRIFRTVLARPAT